MTGAFGLSRHQAVAPGRRRRVSAAKQSRLAPTTQAVSFAPAQRTKALRAAASSIWKALAIAAVICGVAFSGLACAGLGQYAPAAKAEGAGARPSATEKRARKPTPIARGRIYRLLRSE